jgi:chromosome segregation ATPase
MQYEEVNVKRIGKGQKQTFLLGAWILVFTLISPATSSQAAATMGSKCSKVNSFQIINKKIAVCAKRGNSMVWVLANESQKARYSDQLQKKLVSDRKKLIENLLIVKDKYTNVANVIPLMNISLIDSKKAIIDNSRNTIIELQKQKTSEEQAKITNQNSIVNINNLISSAQSNINSLQNQINSMQVTANNSKVLNDSAKNAWVSAKAQSDYLYSSYQSALNSNAAIIANRVLCDFGFTSCSGSSSFQESYNRSVINQYNSASARTAGALASYVSYNEQWVSNLRTLDSLNAQQAQFRNSVNTLNAQKNQANTNIANADTKLTNLNTQITQAQAKFIPLENAERRISQDLSSYDGIKGVLDLKSAELVVAIEAFLQGADEAYISTASSTNWNTRYGNLSNLQKEIDQKMLELKSLISSLEVFLSSF